MAEIAKLDDAKKREEIWSFYYLDKWGELPNQQQQSALKKLWENNNVIEELKSMEGKQEAKEAMEKEWNSFAAQEIFNAFFWDELSNQEQQSASKKSWEKKNVIKELIPMCGKQSANIAMIEGWNSYAAQEIVKAYYSTILRTRGAAIIGEESAKQAATRAANVAITGMKGITTLPVGITAAVGEIVGDMIAAKAGIINHHAKNALGASGAIAGGASAGVYVGGPIGAAVGAAAGAGSWAVGQAIKALMHIGKGPKDNWCYIKIDDIGNDELCVGTYAGNDTMYWKTYRNEYKKSYNEWVMSAGQSQTGVFQLCIWHNGRVIKHFNEVYYRDMFVIIKKGRIFRVVHCRGQHHPIDSGKVYISEN